MASSAPLLPMTGKQAEGGSKDGEPAKKSKKKLLIVVVVLALIGGGAYETVLKPSKPAKTAKGGKTKTVKPKVSCGATLTLDPVTTSISDGHVIQIALGLQVVSGVSTDLITTEAPQADDAANQVLAGYTYKVLLSPAGREKAHKQIKAAVIKAVVDDKSKQEICDVFLPTYVLQ